MRTESEDLQQRLDHLKEGLKRSGVKLTHQRLEILSELVQSSDHPDAEAIYRGVRERVPPISLDTVYRTLWLLYDLGLISVLGQPHARIRFDGNPRPHHHFVCTKCGATHDFYCQEFDGLQIPDAVRAFGRVGRARVELTGLCQRCLEEPEGKGLGDRLGRIGKEE